MNKTQKRQLNLRNKLFAAIAMLLVSSIMMVSTTYAWFTLSTAPEVQGITTTVGANGNLEIALSPASGDANEITSAMGDSNIADSFERNLTWGNLLEMDNSKYYMNEIILMPSRLNATGTGANLTLGENPLQTPVYGADGRLSDLDPNTFFGGKQWTAGADGAAATVNEGWLAENGNLKLRGVRAVGTSSSMSEEEITFRNAISKMVNAMGNSKEAAQISLNANGAALAEMAIKHANGDGDNDYSAFLPDVENVLTELGNANDALESAIKYAMLAFASSENSDADQYAAAVAAITDAADLATLWATYGSDDETLPITKSYKIWSGIATKLTASNNALATAKSADAVTWSVVTPIMSNLMDTGNVTINDKSLSEFKDLVTLGMATELPEGKTPEQQQEAVDFIGSLMDGVNLQLGAGSGVYAELASAVGNLTANVRIAKVSYGDLSVPNVKANIVTTTGNNPELTKVQVALATLGPVTGGDANNVIDVTYGYAVDFMFRTNASGSKLKLQTSAAQRVYEDSSSAATQGHGSTMTFTTGTLDAQAVKNLMGSIRVVFMDPDSKQIYGVGKLNMAQVVENPGATTTEITAYLYLYEVTGNTDGQLTFAATPIAEESATLCDLPTNTAKAVSVLVYLDGDNVTNADVANAQTSMTGTLNLQFASDANLVPMENSALRNMVAEEDEDDDQGQQTPTTYTVNVTNNTSDAATVTAETSATANTNYTFTVTEGYTVTYQVGEGEVKTATATSTTEGVSTYTIPAAEVTGNIAITVAVAPQG